MHQNAGFDKEPAMTGSSRRRFFDVTHKEET
jgi:hypothetical protein